MESVFLTGILLFLAQYYSGSANVHWLYGEAKTGNAASLGVIYYKFITRFSFLTEHRRQFNCWPNEIKLSSQTNYITIFKRQALFFVFFWWGLKLIVSHQTHDFTKYFESLLAKLLISSPALYQRADR